VFVGVVDEPFRSNAITVETNAAVRVEIRKSYLDFCGRRSIELVQSISYDPTDDGANS